MKTIISLVTIAVVMVGCASTGSRTSIRPDSGVHSDCVEACIERTENSEACNKFHEGAAQTCGDLVKAVCEASPNSCD